jgi:hypothetical protein
MFILTTIIQYDNQLYEHERRENSRNVVYNEQVSDTGECPVDIISDAVPRHLHQHLS